MSKLGHSLTAIAPPETEDALRAELEQIRKNISALQEEMMPIKRALTAEYEARLAVEWKLEHIRLMKIQQSKPRYPDTVTKQARPQKELPDINLSDYE